MNKKFYLVLLVAISFLGFMSCNSNDDTVDEPCSAVWATEVQDEVNAWANAAQAYAVDPTPANCAAYKAAAQVYLDALEPYGDCATLTGQQRAEWETALAEAQESLDNSDCQ